TADGQIRDSDFAFARWSALIWSSSTGAIIFSRAASFDIVLTMTITGALAYFLMATLQSEPQLQRILFAGFYFFAGVSLLAKGLIGPVVIFGVIGLYHLLRRELPAKTFLVSLVWGIPLTIATAAVWYGPMLLRHGRTFIDEFIIQQHFARFVSNKYHHP